MNAPSSSPPVAYVLPRPHSDVEYVTIPAGPLGPAGGFNGPAAAPVTPVAAAPGPATPPGPNVTSGPIPTARPVPAPATLAADGSAGDHASPLSAGPMQWVYGSPNVEPSRLSPAHARSLLATTVPHPDASAPAQGSDARPDDAAALPSPHGADLIAEVLPVVGDSLEKGLDEFVRQLESVDVAGLVTHGPAPIVVASAAVLSAAASAIVVREIVRRRQSRRRGLRIVDSLGREFALSFPELPRSWSEKR
jgi:hypothetical protein